MKKFPLFAILLLCGCGYFSQRSEVIIRTENGEPISSANVSYSWSEGGDPWTGKGVRKYTKETTSDPKGLTAIASSGRVTFLRASHEGFYPSRLTLEHHNKDKEQFSITLRQIIAPVSLFGKQCFVNLPRDSGKIGYDLIKGDLVAPFGSGEKCDFEIKWTKPERDHAQDRFDAYDLVAPNDNDGFIAIHIPYNDGRISKSDFHTLYEAPESGYVPSLKEAISLAKMEPRDTYVYYLKIRSKGANGPLYAKIISGPGFKSYNEGYALRFVYMLNTTGERNMEPDIEHSKHPKLGYLEYSLQSSTGLENK